MRLENAQKSYEVAELPAAEQEIPASRSVAAALAVLSGIAAVDAACCGARSPLARRGPSRGGSSAPPDRAGRQPSSQSAATRHLRVDSSDRV
jgi:hypothetical protein